MIWLLETDFETQIQQDLLNQIIEEDLLLLDQAELSTMQEIESYLSNRYDIASLWATAGVHRPSLIVMYAVDILLYHIHSRINPRQIPEIRFVRYEAAIAWLKKAGNGNISAPFLQLLETRTSDIKLVTVKKRRNR